MPLLGFGAEPQARRAAARAQASNAPARHGLAQRQWAVAGIWQRLKAQKVQNGIETQRPGGKTPGPLLMVFQKGVDGLLNAGFFIGTEAAIPGEHGRLLGVELKGFGGLDAAAHVRMADEVVHRGVEKVGDADEDGDFGFDVVVFIFIDRRLGDKNSVS